MFKPILLSFLALTVVSAVIQEITFYSELNFGGDSITFRSQRPNLADFEGIKNYKSACAKGFWVGYRNINYNSHLIYYGNYSNWESVSCANQTFLDVVSSVRHIGSSDLSLPAISLYSSGTLEGQELHVTDIAASNLPFQPRSLASTGRTSWTLYYGPDFSSNSTCIRAGTQNLYYLEGYPFIFYSVVRGCGEEAIENVKSFRLRQ